MFNSKFLMLDYIVFFLVFCIRLFYILNSVVDETKYCTTMILWLYRFRKFILEKPNQTVMLFGLV